MEFFKNLFGNYMLICACFGYLSAQLLKPVFCIIKRKRFDISIIVSSGGMPSSHSATVCALCMASGRLYGVESSAFAVTFILACVVMYDAAGVRRAAGEQAKIINRMMVELLEGKTDYAQKSLKELIGHTPLEVIVGAAMGIAIPFIVRI